MRLDELEFVRLDNATPPKIRAFLRPDCFRWRQNPLKIAIRSDAILSHEPRHVCKRRPCPIDFHGSVTLMERRVSL